jgi:GNAT superfamily N-acetyltransferase
MIKIRKASSADLPAIRGLNFKLFQNELDKYDQTLDAGWTMSERGEDYFNNKINSSDSCAFVAEDDGKIVGYLAGGFTQAEPFRLDRGPLAELENMLVEEAYRGQKVGGGLMEQFILWCQEKNISRVRVVASPGNTAGVKFYERHGFVPLDLTLEKIL